MISQAIFSLLILVLGAVFGLLPDATTLPTWGGVNLDTIFSNGFGYVRYLATIFPPLTVIISAASIYLGFRLILIIVKLVLGHRSPQVHQ